MSSDTPPSLRPLILKVNRAFSADAGENTNEDTKFALLQELFPYVVENDILETYKADIISNYYSLLSCLLKSLKPTLFYKKWQEDLYDSFFLRGVNHDSFMILTRQLSSCSCSYEQDKIVDLLEKFLQRENLPELFLYQCIDSKSWNLMFVSTSSIWNELITLLVSLPERVANKTKGNMKKIFTVSCFVPLVVSSLWKALQRIHEKLLNNEDCSMQFLSKLLGRLCVAGHADIVVKKLSKSFIKVCSADFVWRRISLNLICKIPSSSVEQFFTPLLMNIPWFGFIEWLLGDAVLNNEKLKFLITRKLLLIRRFENPRILQNIVGYLATSNERRPLFYQVLEYLLDVWEDGFSLKYQSYPHQYYLASALMVCAGHLKAMNRKKMAHTSEFMNKILQGVQIRIGNPELSVRTLGMIIGENLMPIFEQNAPELKFEYENSPEIDQLVGLLVLPKRPDDDDDDDVVISILDEELEMYGFSDHCVVKGVIKPTKQEIISEDLDSDDDLKPYDMSEDAPVCTFERPMYIRDCMMGLIERNKVEWIEACLISVEALIKLDTDGVHEVATELAKLLLHLEDAFGIPNFIGLRHRALIALTIECPIQTATFLTSQFYERNYNIRQRLDILEVLAAASQELSQLKGKLPMPQPQSSLSDFMKSTKLHWKHIIDKRVEAKTKRIRQNPNKQIAEPEENRFNLVAGYFFFPLLVKYDKCGKMLDLFDGDSYVLGRLLHTLGIIMFSASNTLISKQMSVSLFQFLKAVRSHSETFVRQAAIFALCTIFISASPLHIITDFQDYVIDNKNWLEFIFEKDPDLECQIKAAGALSLMKKTIESALPLLTHSIADAV